MTKCSHLAEHNGPDASFAENHKEENKEAHQTGTKHDISVLQWYSMYMKAEQESTCTRMTLIGGFHQLHKEGKPIQRWSHKRDSLIPNCLQANLTCKFMLTGFLYSYSEILLLHLFSAADRSTDHSANVGQTFDCIPLIPAVTYLIFTVHACFGVLCFSFRFISFCLCSLLSRTSPKLCSHCCSLMLMQT